MAPLILTIALKLIEMWLDKAKASKEIWEAYQAFIKAVDSHRSVKINESAKRQRDRLK